MEHPLWEMYNFIYADGREDFGGWRRARHGLPRVMPASGWTGRMDEECNSIMFASRARDACVHHMCFPVVPPGTVKRIAEFMPKIVSLGSGTGYLEWLLRQAGADVAATDPNPPYGWMTQDEHNRWFKAYWIKDIRPLDHLRALGRFHRRDVLISWPYMDGWAAEALTKMKVGRKLVYIGEGQGGCCGNDDMFRLLDRKFRKVDEARMENWYGIHDGCEFYIKRKV